MSPPTNNRCGGKNIPNIVFSERNRKYLRYERKIRVAANKKATELMVYIG
jgi:hypothetical protein